MAGRCDEEETTASPDGGYFCPYCGMQGPVDAWWTQAQLKAAQAQAYREVLKPELDKLADSARGTRGGLIDINVEVSEPGELPPFTESNDMRGVDFPCHPKEPAKVLDDWQSEVHCPMCGTPVEGASA